MTQNILKYFSSILPEEYSPLCSVDGGGDIVMFSEKDYADHDEREEIKYNQIIPGSPLKDSSQVSFI